MPLSLSHWRPNASASDAKAYSAGDTCSILHTRPTPLSSPAGITVLSLAGVLTLVLHRPDDVPAVDALAGRHYRSCGQSPRYRRQASVELAAFTRHFGTFIPEPLMQGASFVVSYAVVSALFTLMFKWLPDAAVEWARRLVRRRRHGGAVRDR